MARVTWLFCIVGVVVGWVVLMLITTNLVGFVGRGFLQPLVTPELQSLEQTGGVVADEIRGIRRADQIVTAVFIVVTVGFLWALANFWNIGVVIAAILLMLSRAPDLLWEIRTGQKITRSNMPKGFVSQGATLLSWLALPVLWFSVCR